MRRLLLTIIVFLAVPNAAQAEIFETWRFKTDQDVNSWLYTNIDQGELMSDGLKFAVNEEAVMYRPLPAGFKKADGIRVQIYHGDIDQIDLLLLKEVIDEHGETQLHNLRLKVPLNPSGYTNAYISLSPHKRELYYYENIAFAFFGTSEVIVDGVRFVHYTPMERLIGTWRSFATLEKFRAHTVNILVGPIIDSTIGRFGELDEAAFAFSTSLNAYLYILIALSAITLLGLAAYKNRHNHIHWDVLRLWIVRSLFCVIAVIWFVYDFRMGAEYLSGILNDHVTYVQPAKVQDKAFRERENFYQFVEFAAPFLKDVDTYELFLSEKWPYFGSMLYYTYPALPSDEEEIVGNTYVVYGRDDIKMTDDGYLTVNDTVFSPKGKMLGYFDEGSFVFRVLDSQ